MADTVGRLDEAPPHNAAAHSAALAKHIGKGSPLAAGDPYLVFQQESPESWPPFVRWLRGPLRDKINQLAIFTSDIKGDLDQHKAADNVRHTNIDNRVSALEEGAGFVPFGGSG